MTCFFSPWCKFDRRSHHKKTAFAFFVFFVFQLPSPVCKFSNRGGWRDPLSRSATYGRAGPTPQWAHSVPACPTIPGVPAHIWTTLCPSGDLAAEAEALMHLQLLMYEGEKWGWEKQVWRMLLELPPTSDLVSEVSPDL